MTLTESVPRHVFNECSGRGSAALLVGIAEIMHAIVKKANCSVNAELAVDGKAWDLLYFDCG